MTYGQIAASLIVIRSIAQNNVRFGASKSNVDECKTHQCQFQSKNIGDKVKTNENEARTSCCKRIVDNPEINKNKRKAKPINANRRAKILMLH